MRLNSKFYTEEAVRKTTERFKKICPINYTKEEGFFMIDIEDTPQKKRTEKEFANYCLGMMKS